MPVSIRSSIVGTTLPSPYDLLQTLHDLAAGINAAEAQQTTITQRITRLGDQVSTVINSTSGGGSPIPAPIGPFPAVVVSPTGALDGNGTIGSPLAVRPDGSSITINGSNQLQANIPADVITGTLTSPRIPYASAATVLTDTPDLYWDNTFQSLTIVTAGATLDPPLNAAELPQIHSGGEFDGVAAGHANWYLDSFGNVSSLNFRRANGTQASKTAIGVADMLNLRAIGYDGTAYGIGGFFRFRGTSTWTTSNHGTDFLVFLAADGSAPATPTEALRVQATNLQIGAQIGTVATTGVIRLPNNQYLFSRGNTAVNIQLIGATNNVVSVGDLLRTCQLAEVWETEAGNGDFRPITNNARNLGGSTRIVLNVFTSKLTNPAQATAATGNQAAFAVTSSLLRAANAATLTLQGIVAGASGQLLEIMAVGAAQVDIADEDAAAAAADRIITPTGGTVTVTAGVGYAKLRYDGTSSRWRLLIST